MFHVTPTDALLVTDVQNDFCSGGALPVPDAEMVVRPINSTMKFFDHLVFSRDWHPDDHCSFDMDPQYKDKSWPVHCVQDTPGAEFHGDLRVPVDAFIISKATNANREAYSAFDGTGLDALLRQRGVTRVFVTGLTLDYCVRATVLDALKAGFDVVLIEDATRPVEPDNTAAILDDLRTAGARICKSDTLS